MNWLEFKSENEIFVGRKEEKECVVKERSKKGAVGARMGRETGGQTQDHYKMMITLIITLLGLPHSTIYLLSIIFSCIRGKNMIVIVYLFLLVFGESNLFLQNVFFCIVLWGFFYNTFSNFFFVLLERLFSYIFIYGDICHETTYSVLFLGVKIWNQLSEWVSIIYLLSFLNTF